ncbi:14872_t:CDS:2, partial [Acaulospora morrowiae]
GGGAFYFAKKDIDARRRAQELAKTRPTEKLEWWQKVAKDEVLTNNDDGNTMSQVFAADTSSNNSRSQTSNIVRPESGDTRRGV